MLETGWLHSLVIFVTRYLKLDHSQGGVLATFIAGSHWWSEQRHSSACCPSAHGRLNVTCHVKTNTISSHFPLHLSFWHISNFLSTARFLFVVRWKSNIVNFFLPPVPVLWVRINTAKGKYRSFMKKDLDDIVFQKSKHSFPFNLLFFPFSWNVYTTLSRQGVSSYHTCALLYITLMSSNEWHYDVKSPQIVSACCTATGN